MEKIIRYKTGDKLEKEAFIPSAMGIQVFFELMQQKIKAVNQNDMKYSSIKAYVCLYNKISPAYRVRTRKYGEWINFRYETRTEKK